MASHWGQALTAIRIAGETKRQDAEVQRRTMIVGEDADWLLQQIGNIGNAPMTVHSDRERCFGFLSDDAEVVLTQTSESDDLIEIRVPTGSVVSRTSGCDADSWVYRVTIGSASQGGYFEVAYRKVGEDYLPYLFGRTLR